MTPAARYAAAISVLEAWSEGRPLSRALTSWARGARYAGSKDRAAVQDHVYDVLRRKGSCAALGGGDSARQLILGVLRLQGLTPDEVFTGVGHAPAPLTEAETAAGMTLAQLPATLDIPVWLQPRFEASLGADAQPVCAALQTRAPVYLRANRRKTSRAQAVAALAGQGIAAEPVAEAPDALLVREGARKIRNAPAYLQGEVEIQDLSAQRAVAFVTWPTRGAILDYCAGGGGKSLAIAATSGARIMAHDAHARRMADLPDRARRAGVRIGQLSQDQARKAAPFDAVLCDVPCSGSGTWRRDPEAKWRLTPERLQDLRDLQARILDEAAGLVAPQGQLVYMTCSLLAEENSEQIARFCARHPGWSCQADRLDTPLTASDGFYVAILTRQAGSDPNS